MERYATVIAKDRQEDHMIILEPNGRLDRPKRRRRSLLALFGVKLVHLLRWR